VNGSSGCVLCDTIYALCDQATKGSAVSTAGLLIAPGLPQRP